MKILIGRTQKKLADQGSRRARAQAEFTEGVRLYALGQVRQGLAKFQAAYQVLPSTGYRYHIAQCHRKLKEWKQAVFYYEGYLRDNPATPMASLVEAHLKECRQRLEEAELKRRGVLNPNLGSSGKGGTGGVKVVPLYKKWWLWTVTFCEPPEPESGVLVNVLLPSEDLQVDEIEIQGYPDGRLYDAKSDHH